MWPQLMAMSVGKVAQQDDDQQDDDQQDDDQQDDDQQDDDQQDDTSVTCRGALRWPIAHRR